MLRFRVSLVVLAVAVLVAVPVVVSTEMTYRQAVALSETSPLEAARLFERAAHLRPWDPSLWELAGAGAYAGGDFPQAVRLFEIARERRALTGPRWDELGLAYWNLGQTENALRAWQEALRVSGPQPKLYLRLANYYYLTGERQAEQEALANLAALDPGNAEARYRLGLLLTVSEPDPALDHLLAASRLDERYAPAVDALRGALNLSRVQADPAQAKVILGQGLASVDEWELAQVTFEQAVGADAGNAGAWAWLGLAKQANGQAGSGEMDQALALDSQSADIHAQRGLFFERAGDWEQAEESYLEAVRLDPSDPAWHAALGQATTHLGDLPLALAYYKHAAELAPDEAKYWRLLAVFCARNGVYLEDEGLPAAVKARDLAPDDPAALDAVGWVFLGLGNLEMAQEYFSRALQAAPGFALAWLHQGQTYLELGERDAAVAALQNAALDHGP
ncbi:MAG: tetratricopeptide repeat protein, partial [Chloroflexota bacterium]